MSWNPDFRTAPAPASERIGSLLAGISRDIVRVHARYYGRGPTKAKTVWKHGMTACILEEIFTEG